MQGDPTYLVVENDRTLAPYGINAVCTHLGCVVPFNTAEKKFICPCHGSQYSNQGRVVRGPAPLVSCSTTFEFSPSLALSFSVSVNYMHLIFLLNSRWHWHTLMLTMERYCLFRGWKQISEQVKIHGGLKPFHPNTVLPCPVYSIIKPNIL